VKSVNLRINNGRKKATEARKNNGITSVRKYNIQFPSLPKIFPYFCGKTISNRINRPFALFSEYLNGQLALHSEFDSNTSDCGSKSLADLCQPAFNVGQNMAGMFQWKAVGCEAHERSIGNKSNAQSRCNIGTAVTNVALGEARANQ
jgi:hypothetical protein